jgi:hypothetical protein
MDWKVLLLGPNGHTPTTYIGNTQYVGFLPIQEDTCTLVCGQWSHTLPYLHKGHKALGKGFGIVHQSKLHYLGILSLLCIQLQLKARKVL